MPAVEELVAHDRTSDEVQQAIGADWLIYQDLEDLFESVRKRNPEITDFDAACFTQNYVTGTVSDEYLKEQGLTRSDGHKAKNEFDPSVIELHNAH